VLPVPRRATEQAKPGERAWYFLARHPAPSQVPADHRVPWNRTTRRESYDEILEVTPTVNLFAPDSRNRVYLNLWIYHDSDTLVVVIPHTVRHNVPLVVQHN